MAIRRARHTAGNYTFRQRLEKVRICSQTLIAWQHTVGYVAGRPGRAAAHPTPVAVADKRYALTGMFLVPHMASSSSSLVAIKSSEMGEIERVAIPATGNDTVYSFNPLQAAVKPFEEVITWPVGTSQSWQSWVISVVAIGALSASADSLDAKIATAISMAVDDVQEIHFKKSSIAFLQKNRALGYVFQSIGGGEIFITVIGNCCLNEVAIRNRGAGQTTTPS